MDFQGFSVTHTVEEIVNNATVNCSCMSVDFENTGQQNCLVGLKNSTKRYVVSSGESISFLGENSNPLLRIDDLFTLEFTGAGTKVVLVTKRYATPTILTF